jgi:inorganic phosphate transporter, PiT family
VQPLDLTLYLIAALVALALAFGFMNGFHDAADAITTVVSTGVLKPHQAVLMAAFFNVLAILFFPLHVAATLATGTVDAVAADHHVMFGALAGAVFWLLVAWSFGIPSSATHALIGGLLGAAVAKGGAEALIAAGVVKVLGFVLLAPVLGFAFGTLTTILVAWLFVRSTPRRVDKGFRRMQLVSAAMYSLGHGANNAQKCMGVIWMLLIAAGAMRIDAQLPYWVVASSYAAIGLGTLLGGWRIVKTMRQKISKLKPVDGFCAEAGGAMTLFLANGLGIPVSTKQAITGAVVGVGSSRRMSAVRWGVASSMVWAWIFTIPAAAFSAAIAWWLSTLLF